MLSLKQKPCKVLTLTNLYVLDKLYSTKLHLNVFEKLDIIIIAILVLLE